MTLRPLRHVSHGSTGRMEIQSYTIRDQAATNGMTSKALVAYAKAMMKGDKAIVEQLSNRAAFLIDLFRRKTPSSESTLASRQEARVVPVPCFVVCGRLRSCRAGACFVPCRIVPRTVVRCRVYCCAVWSRVAVSCRWLFRAEPWCVVSRAVHSPVRSFVPFAVFFHPHGHASCASHPDAHVLSSAVAIGLSGLRRHA